MVGRGSHDLELADARDLGLELGHCWHQAAADLRLEDRHLAVAGRHALGELEHLIAGLPGHAADNIDLAL